MADDRDTNFFSKLKKKIRGKVEDLKRNYRKNFKKSRATSNSFFKQHIKKFVDKKDVKYFDVARGQFVGGLFFYEYDAKWKHTLPVWDRYPLVMPIEQYNDGFLGINFHFINEAERIALIEVLREMNKGNIGYGSLKSMLNQEPFKKSIKRYLITHVKTKFIEVDKEWWGASVFLPVQEFVYKSDNK